MHALYLFKRDRVSLERSSPYSPTGASSQSTPRCPRTTVAVMHPKVGCAGIAFKADVPAVQQPPCEPDFIQGKPHIQSKFCKYCREGFAVRATNVRKVVRKEGVPVAFTNSPREGFWNNPIDGLEFRVINQ